MSAVDKLNYRQYSMLMQPHEFIDDKEVRWLDGGEDGDDARDDMLDAKLTESRSNNRGDWGGGVYDGVMNNDPMPPVTIHHKGNAKHTSTVHNGNHRIAAFLEKESLHGETYMPVEHTWQDMPGVTGGIPAWKVRDRYDRDAGRNRERFGLKYG